MDSPAFSAAFCFHYNWQKNPSESCDALPVGDNIRRQPSTGFSPCRPSKRGRGTVAFILADRDSTWENPLGFPGPHTACLVVLHNLQHQNSQHPKRCRAHLRLQGHIRHRLRD